MTYKAGSAQIDNATSSETVAFTTNMANTNYAVELTITSTTAFMSTNADCTNNDNGCFWYLATTKTTSGFTIQLREADGGGLIAANANVTFDWFVIPYNNP